MKFEYFMSKKNGQWYFHIRAKNGQIIAQSEGYHNKNDVLDAINKIIWRIRLWRIRIKKVEE